jgi:hypothetical protein
VSARGGHGFGSKDSRRCGKRFPLQSKK